MSASAVLKLQKVGFSIEQVEALADFMDTQAASKADLNDAKAELKSDIAGVRSEIAEVRSELKLSEQRTIIRLGGLLVVITGILLGAIRYLPPH